MFGPLVVAHVVIPEAELRWTAARASGPGGQNVNKVSSKVELRFDLERSRVLDLETKVRLRAIAGGRVDAQGQILVVSQATRDRQRNLDDARQKLAELVVRACTRPKRRRPTRPSRGAKETRLREKKLHSVRKRDRGRSSDSD